MVPWVLLLGGCLERVTGEAVPLDPAFYAGHSDHGGDGQPGDGGGGPGGGTPGDGQGGDGTPGDGQGGGGSGPAQGEAPWAGFDGVTWTLTGVVAADEEAEVQIDVNQPDPDAPGGQTRAGAIRVPGLGEFEVKVPTTVKEVRLAAFQDLDADGPDEDDPYAEAVVQWSGADPAPVTLTLVKGARGKAGAPGGGGNGSPSAPPEGLAFPEGPKITISGTVDSPRDLPVVLDFFHANGEGAGGRTYLGRRTVAKPGAWSEQFPRDYGAVEIEAYQDLTGDSRTGDDPAGRLERPLTIAGSDVEGISLTIP